MGCTVRYGKLNGLRSNGWRARLREEERREERRGVRSGRADENENPPTEAVVGITQI